MFKKKKTILIYVWNLGLGGVQKKVVELANYLNKNRPEYQLVILVKYAFPTSLLEKLKKIKNIKIYSYKSYRVKNQLVKLLSFCWLIKLYWKIDPDIVLTFLCRFSVYMAILKIIFFWKKVVLVLNEEIFTSNYLKLTEGSYWAYLIKVFYPQANLIIAQTETIKSDLHHHF